MIKREVFKQETAAASWVVPITEPNASMGRALAVYDPAGNTIQWDSWEFKDGVLHVNFGVDPVVGSLYYEYQLPDGGCTERPLVSIVNNYGDIQLSHSGM